MRLNLQAAAAQVPQAPTAPQAPSGTIPAAPPTPTTDAVQSAVQETEAAKQEAETKTHVSDEGKRKAADAASKVDAGKKKTDSKAAQKAKSEERKKIIAAEKLFKEGIASIRDLIAPSSFEVGYDHLKMDGLYLQSFFVHLPTLHRYELDESSGEL